ncbi:hypothetical protein [Actinocrispum sp. NPDC049592]|uniref:hypothetical protein n=1 Tax=Actinocrispum sp. NPDC049592 TaxID=3154835 RepID=UPI003435AA01
MLEGPPNEEQSEVRQPRRWLRWAMPIGAGVLVAGAVGGIVLAQQPSDAPSGATGPKQAWKPRFMVTASRSGGASWFDIFDTTKTGQQDPIASVEPPSPTAGSVASIVGGPGRTFVVAAVKTKPCETELYQFTLTDDGHAKNIAPVTGGTVPALAAGLAISPDGRRIAYATAPCGEKEADSPALATPTTMAVLDSVTGKRRTWTMTKPMILGELVWASDNHTLGYTTGEFTQPTNGSRKVTVGKVQSRALDVDAEGSDLLSGRVLFDSAAEDGRLTMAVMNPDGRTGFGMLQKKQPPSILMFSYAEGQPMKVTSTVPAEPNGTVPMISIATNGGPRYACLSGLDAFGRESNGELRDRAMDRCSTAYETPS